MAGWFVNVEPGLCQGLLCFGISSIKGPTEKLCSICADSLPEKQSLRGGGDWLVVNAGRGRRTLFLNVKQYVWRTFLYFPGSPTLDLKLVTHVKNIKVVFLLSPFRFMSNAAAKGLPRKARFPGVLQWWIKDKQQNYYHLLNTLDVVYNMLSSLGRTYYP